MGLNNHCVLSALSTILALQPQREQSYPTIRMVTTRAAAIPTPVAGSMAAIMPIARTVAARLYFMTGSEAA